MDRGLEAPVKRYQLMMRSVVFAISSLLLCGVVDCRNVHRTPRHEVDHNNIINTGTDFVFAYTNSHLSSSTEKLTLTFTNADPNQSALVKISSIFSQFVNQTVTVPSESSASAVISPVSVQAGYNYDKLEGTVVENKGISIQSSIPVTVLAENQHVDGGSSDAFTVFPLCNLGTQYKAIGDLGTKNTTNLYTIVATEDNTHVVFTHSKGTVSRKLGRLQTATFVSMESITTNNPISADKKIAVVSGAVCGFGNMQITSPCNEEALMLLPVTAWGRTYPFAPFHGNTQSEIVILPSQSGTQITIGSHNDRKLQNDTYLLEKMGADVIKGSHPIDIIAVGGTTAPDYMGAPFFAHVPSISQFVTGSLTLHTGIDQHDSNVSKHWVRIVQHINNLDSVSINEWPVSGLIYTRIGRSKYFYIDYPIANGKHTVAGAKPFGCLVYGYGEFTGYAYVPSLQLPSTGTC